MGPSPNPRPSPNPEQVNVGSVLHNMRQRYELQEIYTSIGPQVPANSARHLRRAPRGVHVTHTILSHPCGSVHPSPSLSLAPQILTLTLPLTRS